MNIYVGNLPYTTTEDELKALFSNYGTVLSVVIIVDRYTGRSKGFGFVEMATQREGETAIAELDGYLFNGRNLRVNTARPRQPRRPRRDSWY